MPVGHKCCDKCAEYCTCKDGHYCNVDVYLPVGHPDKELDACGESVARNVTDEQRENLTHKLCLLHKQIIAKDANVGHVTYPTTFMQFGKSQINEVIEKCNLIFTVSDVLKNVQIWHKRYAIMVLKIISDVFGDVV